MTLKLTLVSVLSWLPAVRNSAQTDGQIKQFAWSSEQKSCQGHVLETSRPCRKCSTSEMVQYIWSGVESCWDDAGGTGENAVNGRWDLLKVVEKKMFRSLAFCRSVLPVCSPC